MNLLNSSPTKQKTSKTDSAVRGQVCSVLNAFAQFLSCSAAVFRNNWLFLVCWGFADLCDHALTMPHDELWWNVSSFHSSTASSSDSGWRQIFIEAHRGFRTMFSLFYVHLVTYLCVVSLFCSHFYVMAFFLLNASRSIKTVNLLNKVGVACRFTLSHVILGQILFQVFYFTSLFIIKETLHDLC